MPQTYYRLLKDAEITVWRADKDVSYYKKYLEKNHFPTAAADSIKNLEKRKQWYLSRFVLTQVYPEAIQFYAQQKPVLMNGPRISISHSGEDVAIMISEYEGGIDIQWPDEKLLKISPKYANESDLLVLNSLSYLEAHTLLWSIKEAVFKHYGAGITFKNIRLKSYDSVHNAVDVDVLKENQVDFKKLCADFIGEMSIAYLIE